MTNATALLNCTDSPYFSQDRFLSWKNYSKFSNDWELATYICENSKFYEFRIRLNLIVAYLQMVFSILGIFSCIIILLTLSSKKHFDSTSFIYFRTVAFFQIFEVSFIFFNPGRPTLSCDFRSNIGEKSINSTTMLFLYIIQKLKTSWRE